MTVLKNVTYYDFKTARTNAYMVFDSQIQKIGDMEEWDEKAYEGQEILDVRDHLVLPSLVVGHTHVYSVLSRGLCVPFDPHDFKELLDQLWWKVDSALGRAEIYYSGIVSGVEFAKNGVTTLIDHHASGEIKGSLSMLKKAIVEDVGLRGIFCFETSDRFDVDTCILENIRFIETNKDPRAQGLFGAHASLSLSEDTLRKMKEVTGETPLHIHVAESLQDEEECLALYQERVVERLDRFELLTKDSVLAHCIHVNDKELQIIKDRGCLVAVNPSSNMNNGVGLPYIKKMRQMGIPIIIGNDGISTSMVGEWVTLLFAMHHLYGSPTSMGFEQLKEIINETYAYAGRRLGVRLGKIEIGYESDLLILPYIPPTPFNEDSAMGHIVFGLAGGFKPKDVICSGKWIVREYEVHEDLKTKYYQAKPHGKHLWEKINKGEVSP